MPKNKKRLLQKQKNNPQIQVPNQPTVEILHTWGVVYPETWSEEYQKAIRLFIAGEYGLLDLKRLKNSDVYRIKVNKSDRLLLTLRWVEGKSYFEFIEEVNRHKYKKCRFLKDGVLKHYLHKTEEEFKKLVLEETDFVQDDGADLPKFKKNSPIKYVPLHFFKNQFLRLSPAQEEINIQELPLVVRGGPGTGKTSTAFTKAKYLVKTFQDKKFLFLTKNEKLLKELADEWMNSPDLTEEEQQRLCLKSFYELMQERLSAQMLNKTMANEEHFRHWFHEFSAKNDYPIIDNEIYEEFGYMAFYVTVEDYVKAEEGNKYFSIEQKKNLWHLWQIYQAYLDKNNFFDPAFIRLENEGIYDAVIADEIQDFTNLDLENVLFHIAKDNKCLLCLDNRQSLKHKQSRSKFIRQLIHTKAQNLVLSELELEEVYRFCSRQIFNAVKGWERLTNHVLGGALDKHQKNIALAPAKYLRDDGVLWMNITVENEKEISLLQERAKYADFAVITNNKNAPLIKKIAAVNTLTPEEAKGFEFREVFYDGLFDGSVFVEFSQLLKGLKIDSLQEKNNQPKDKTLLDKFLKHCSLVIVGLSRATELLILNQEKKHKLSFLLSLWAELIYGKEGVATEKNLQNTEVARKANEDERLDLWEEIAKNYYRDKKFTLMEDIFNNHLKNRKLNSPEQVHYDNFNHFKEYIKQQLASKEFKKAVAEDTCRLKKKSNTNSFFVPKKMQNDRPQLLLTDEEWVQQLSEIKNDDKILDGFFSLGAEEILRILFYLPVKQDCPNLWISITTNTEQYRVLYFYIMHHHCHTKFSEELLTTPVGDGGISRFEHIVKTPAGAKFINYLLVKNKYQLKNIAQKNLPSADDSWDNFTFIGDLCVSVEGIELVIKLLELPAFSEYHHRLDNRLNSLVSWSIINKKLDLAVQLFKSESNNLYLQKNKEGKTTLQLINEHLSEFSYEQEGMAEFIYMISIACTVKLKSVYLNHLITNDPEDLDAYLDDPYFYQYLAYADTKGNNGLQRIANTVEFEDLVVKIINHRHCSLKLLRHQNAYMFSLKEIAKQKKLPKMMQAITVREQELLVQNQLVEVNSLLADQQYMFIDTPPTLSNLTEKNLQLFFHPSRGEDVLINLFTLPAHERSCLWEYLIDNNVEEGVFFDYMQNEGAGFGLNLLCKTIPNIPHLTYCEQILQRKRGWMFIHLIMQLDDEDPTPLIDIFFPPGVETCLWAETMERFYSLFNEGRFIMTFLETMFSRLPFFNIARKQDAAGDTMLHWAIEKNSNMMNVLLSSPHCDLSILMVMNNKQAFCANMLCHYRQIAPAHLLSDSLPMNHFLSKVFLDMIQLAKINHEQFSRYDPIISNFLNNNEFFKRIIRCPLLETLITQKDELFLIKIMDNKNFNDFASGLKFEQLAVLIATAKKFSLAKLAERFANINVKRSTLWPNFYSPPAVLTRTGDVSMGRAMKK